MVKKFDMREQLNYIRILIGDYVLCKKTYSKENGKDKELLIAGYQYVLRQNQEGIYVSDGVNKYYLYHIDTDCSMFVREHFLSSEERDGIWVRLEIECSKYVDFAAHLSNEFILSTVTNQNNIMQNLIVDEKINGCFIVYTKVQLGEIFLIAKAVRDYFQDEALHFKCYLYEVEIDVSETNFYHKV